MMTPKGQDREKLIAEARTGDAGALGRLLELYRAYLTLLAQLQISRSLQGKADAADLVQETFLEAARFFGGFRGATEPELAAWLRQILASRLTNLVRRYRGTQARDVRLERMLGDELDQSSQALGAGLVADQSTPSQQASRREQAVLLADALDRLPPDYRAVLVLRTLEGLSFPEVAARMGRSLDSVEKLWVRALPRLRQALGEGP
jgi:RNA polymerase sigma-70 factor (ECF subfamily)